MIAKGTATALRVRFLRPIIPANWFSKPIAAAPRKSASGTATASPAANITAPNRPIAKGSAMDIFAIYKLITINI
jgi:hypothetical protein